MTAELAHEIDRVGELVRRRGHRGAWEGQGQHRPTVDLPVEARTRVEPPLSGPIAHLPSSGAATTFTIMATG
jgi:hypothetical protein